MERLLQYLDDLDDLYGMAGLLVERLRRFVVALFTVLLTVVCAVPGIWLALRHPPLALAITTLLIVFLLYRSVTAPLGGRIQTA